MLLNLKNIKKITGNIELLIDELENFHSSYNSDSQSGPFYENWYIEIIDSSFYNREYELKCSNFDEKSIFVFLLPRFKKEEFLDKLPSYFKDIINLSNETESAVAILYKTIS